MRPKAGKSQRIRGWVGYYQMLSSGFRMAMAVANRGTHQLWLLLTQDLDKHVHVSMCARTALANMDSRCESRELLGRKGVHRSRLGQRKAMGISMITIHCKLV